VRDTIQKIQRGIAAIGDEHQRTFRQPAPELQQHLTPPVEQRFVTLPPFLVITLRRSQHRQEGQSPHSSRPGDFDQQHKAEPAQTAGFHKVRMRAAYRIAIDAARLDFSTPASLDGVIESYQNRAGRSKELHEQAQQDATASSATPAGSVQHAMVVLKALLAAESQDAECRTDGPLPGS
jgi:hypothetical protein